MSLAQYFSKSFWQKNYPVWQDYDAWHSLGLPDLKAGYEPAKKAVQITPPPKPGSSAAVSAAAEQEGSAFGKLLFGMILGSISYMLIAKRQLIYTHVRDLVKNNLTKA
jgi:hypothetical protein